MLTLLPDNYPPQLGSYLKAEKSGCSGYAYSSGVGVYQLYWDEQADGPPPSVAEVEVWEPSSSVTDVEIYKEVFVTARKNATLLIDTIKASVQDALVKSKAYSRSDATIQGVDFVFCHGDAISKYKEAGGHPAAASKLLSAFKSEGSVALFPWVKSVGAIFDQALTY